MSDLPAGRELDALVAEKVMGEQMPPIPSDNRAFPRAFHGSITGDCETSHGGSWALATSGYLTGDEIVWVPKPYSTDIAAAWEVVEKLRALNPTCEVWLRVEANGVGSGISFKGDVEYDWYDLDVREFGDTAPLAICRAALKAVA